MKPQTESFEDIEVDLTTIGTEYDKQIREYFLLERILDRLQKIGCEDMTDYKTRNKFKSALMSLHGFLAPYIDQEYKEEVTPLLKDELGTGQDEIITCYKLWAAEKNLISRTPLHKKPTNIFETTEGVSKEDYEDWSRNVLSAYED